MIRWHRSSYSDSRGECVELARLDSETAGVRDSKDLDGPRHTFSISTLRSLLMEIKGGEHTLS